MNRDNFYLSTIDPHAATLAKAYDLGLEIAEYCTAMNMDAGFTETDKRVRAELSSSDRAIFHGPFNELFPCAIDPLARELAAKRYRQSIALAREYGIRKIVFHGGYQPNVYFPIWYVEQSVLFWRTFLKEVPHDITICIENVLEETPEMLIAIVREIHDPRLGICLDIGHTNTYSKVPVQDWLRISAPFIRHFHIHNNYGDRDAHNALQDGSMDIPALLREIDKTCPNATITLELPDSKSSIMDLETNGFFR